MKTLSLRTIPLVLAALLPLAAAAQVNSGSDGRDGVFNPSADIVVNMADHADGIYQYASVNIPLGVTVTFTPNPKNKPVVWLVQGSCVIAGTVNLSGQSSTASFGAVGGPGGGQGGNAGSGATSGQGIGGGAVGGSSGSYATAGYVWGSSGPAAPVYGSKFLVPLAGGSGGGGGGSCGGGGGGGAILIAADEVILNGNIAADGAYNSAGAGFNNAGGAGSGGAIRIVGNRVLGSGSLSAAGGGFFVVTYWGSYLSGSAGVGRIRIDCIDNRFGGSTNGDTSVGFQPIILPAPDQGVQLNIASVAGVAVPANSGGVLANPDVVISGQQANPIPIVINCSNLPLNTEITVNVRPANGPVVTAVGVNNVGTSSSSTATISVNMPRGGGIIYAKAVTGIAGAVATVDSVGRRTRSLAETGWTADGESFVAMEINAGLGGQQSIAYLTKSGKRYTSN